MSEEISMGPRNGERLPEASTADEETPAVGAAEQQATPVNVELPVDGVGSPQVAVDEMVGMEATASSEGSADVSPGVEQTPHIDVERPATDDKIAAFLHGDRVSAAVSHPHTTWTVPTVIKVGLILIGAATVAGIVRDVVFVQILEARAEARSERMREDFERTYEGFGGFRRGP